MKAEATRRFKPYPAYEDSGACLRQSQRGRQVEWLGHIPAHWGVKRLRHLAATNPESLGEENDPTIKIVYVDIGGVDSLGRIIERDQLTFATAPSRARRVVRDRVSGVPHARPGWRYLLTTYSDQLLAQ